MCGSLVVDGGEERGGATHQLVVRLGGAGCDWPYWAWRAEVIGGAGGGSECKRGKMEDGNGAKQKRAKTLDHCRLSSGFGAWAGWLAGLGLGLEGGTDVELELESIEPVDELLRQARGRPEACHLQSCVCLPSLLHIDTWCIHPNMQPIPVPVSCLIWAHLVHDFPNHTEPAAEAERAQDPRPENQDPRERPSKTQRKPRPTRYPPRQHMDGEQLVSPTPCLTNSLLIGVDRGGSKRDGDQTPNPVVGLFLFACQSIL